MLYNNFGLLLNAKTKCMWLITILLPTLDLLTYSKQVLDESHWHSQNAEKVTHIKMRLLDQAVIQFNCVPFHNENFSIRKEFAPSGS